MAREVSAVPNHTSVPTPPQQPAAALAQVTGAQVAAQPTRALHTQLLALPSPWSPRACSWDFQLLPWGEACVRVREFVTVLTSCRGEGLLAWKARDVATCFGWARFFRQLVDMLSPRHKAQLELLLEWEAAQRGYVTEAPLTVKFLAQGCTSVVRMILASPFCLRHPDPHFVSHLVGATIGTHGETPAPHARRRECASRLGSVAQSKASCSWLADILKAHQNLAPPLSAPSDSLSQLVLARLVHIHSPHAHGGARIPRPDCVRRDTGSASTPRCARESAVATAVAHLVDYARTSFSALQSCAGVLVVDELPSLHAPPSSQVTVQCVQRTLEKAMLLQCGPRLLQLQDSWLAVACERRLGIASYVVDTLMARLSNPKLREDSEATLARLVARSPRVATAVRSVRRDLEYSAMHTSRLGGPRTRR